MPAVMNSSPPAERCHEGEKKRAKHVIEVRASLHFTEEMVIRELVAPSLIVWVSWTCSFVLWP